MKILKIAVTGSAGSGKSLVCQRFRDLGLVTLSCDEIARQVVEPGKAAYKEIIEVFGRCLIQEDGSLDRAELREILVSNEDMRRKLDSILHPRILNELFLQVRNADYRDKKAVAVEIPLLFELNMDKKFDIAVTVVAEDFDLVRRISGRDRVSSENAGKMLALQMTQQDKIDRSDYVIENQGTVKELFDSVDRLYNKIKKEFLTYN